MALKFLLGEAFLRLSLLTYSAAMTQSPHRAIVGASPGHHGRRRLRWRNGPRLTTSRTKRSRSSVRWTIMSFIPLSWGPRVRGLSPGELGREELGDQVFVIGPEASTSGGSCPLE